MVDDSIDVVCFISVALYFLLHDAWRLYCLLAVFSTEIQKFAMTLCSGLRVFPYYYKGPLLVVTIINQLAH
jgi:hypothetical protein